MVRTHAHPGSIRTNVINPIRIGPPEFLVDEVVHLDLDGLTTGQPLLTGILEGSHQFLLRVHRNHRLIGLQGRTHRRIDMLELRIAIRALIAFEYFDIALQAVVLAFEEFAHHDMADLVAFGLEFISQMAQTLAGPAQW